MVNKNSPTYKAFLYWIPLAVVTTLIFLTIYGETQQTLRQVANDPQIQIAEDAAAALGQGSAPQSLVSSTSADMSQSLHPFLIIYDASGQVLAGDGQLDGNIPVPPRGVFTYVRTSGEDRLTWEPAHDVRTAAVVTQFTGTSSSGFVLAGRSLREVEEREETALAGVIIGWIISLILSLFIFIGVYKINSK